MWPKKKLFPWEVAPGTPPKQSPIHPWPAHIPGNDPNFKWGAQLQFPNLPLITYPESNSSPLIPHMEDDPWGRPTKIPSGVDPGLVAANARVASGTTIPQTSGSAGGGKWKKVIEQLGKMTGPEPDWSLSAQNVGVRSPWSPTNVAWSAVGSDMFGRKKKESPY